MKVIAVTILLLAALADTCVARVGETREEIIKRYGTPKPYEYPKPADESLDFEFEGWSITVKIWRGRSVEEWYRRPVQTQQGKVDDTLSEHLIDLSLGANSAGQEWQPVQRLRVRQRERDIGSSLDFERLQNAWRLADGSRYAAHMRAVEGNWQQPSRVPRHFDYLFEGLGQSPKERRRRGTT